MSNVVASLLVRTVRFNHTYELLCQLRGRAIFGKL